tara:strand:- start:201 stop:437 length:237 start_codon:yes stop_codon:yes gene_type:complete
MSQWFYIQQWKQKAWERLLEHRTIRVSWDTDEEDQREIMPQFVRIPDGIDLTNESISNYLSDTFGRSVADWNVARGSY